MFLCSSVDSALDISPARVPLVVAVCGEARSVGISHKLRERRAQRADVMEGMCRRRLSGSTRRGSKRSLLLLQNLRVRLPSPVCVGLPPSISSNCSQRWDDELVLV